MSGTIINDYNIGDTNFDALMTTVDAQRIGFNSLTLTEFDTTTVPQIAAGSKVEVNGALYKFDSATSISGSPSDGAVYILLEPQAGTASGATTDATGYATSSTTITLASAGTGTILAGDRVTFGSDTVKYTVTSGDADVSNGGSITIESPGLLTAIPASATNITVYGGSIDASFTNTAPTWSDSKQGWYGTGGNANSRYVAKMRKDSTSYAAKSLYNSGIIVYDTFDIGSALLLDSSIVSGIMEGFSLHFYDGSDSQIVPSGTVGTSSGFEYVALNPGRYILKYYLTGDPDYTDLDDFYIKRPITCKLVQVIAATNTFHMYCVGASGIEVLDKERIIEIF